MSQDNRVQIYVALLNEGVDVWRPVEAIAKEEGVYQITSENHAADSEQWAFSTGDLVRCVHQEFSDGSSGLVAVAKVSRAF